MGSLRSDSIESGPKCAFELVSDTLIGRSARADLRLSPSILEVSNEHARIQWDGEDWCLEDRSRNGTWLNGARLPQGERFAIATNDQLAFGQPHLTWVVASVEPPVVHAICESTGQVLAGTTTAVELSGDGPATRVWLHPRGSWLFGPQDAAVEVSDGDRLPAGGSLWRVRLPTPWIPTRPSFRWEVSRLMLTFELDSASSSCRLWAQQDGIVVDLGAGKPWLTAEMYARRRIMDARAEADGAHAGCIDAAEAMRQAQLCSPETLRVHRKRANATLQKRLDLPRETSIFERVGEFGHRIAHVSRIRILSGTEDFELNLSPRRM